MKRLYKLYEVFDMKIAYKKEIKTFNEIESGQVFSAANMEFMKLNTDSLYNAVRLDDGTLFGFDAEDLCDPLDATLVIE